MGEGNRMKLFRENGQVIAVIISVIVVGVVLSGRISRMEERLTALFDRWEARIVEDRIDRLEDRVRSIEDFLREDR